MAIIINFLCLQKARGKKKVKGKNYANVAKS